MPLTHISMRAGKPDSYRAAILDGVTRALHETFDLPDDNEFVVLTEHDPTNFRYSNSYLGVERSDDLVVIQVTANDSRSLAQKKTLFARMADLLGDNPGVRREDVFVSLVEVKKENWSLGLGLAQYA